MMLASDTLPPIERIRQILSSSPAALFAVDAEGTFQFLSPAWTSITGYGVADCIGRSCREFVHWDDQFRLTRKLRRLFAGQETSSRSEYRALCANGEHRWVEVRAQASTSPTGHIDGLFGTIVDITDRKRHEALSQGKQNVLKALVAGATLSNLFDRICYLAEELIEGCRASILFLDRDGQHLRFGAGPNLAVEYNAAIDGSLIGPRAGSCGTAAFTGEPVIVEDIASDPLWCDHSHLALEQGLRACWSYPLVVDGGAVLGTFAIYQHDPCRPGSWEQEVAERLARLAAVVAKKRFADEALVANEQRYALVMQGANVGLWEIDFQQGTMFISPLYRTMVGLAPDEPIVGGVTPENPLPVYMLDRLHPEDRGRTLVMIQRHLAGQGPYVTDYRLRQPDGQYRWFQARGQAAWGAKGRPVRMAGSIYDSTEQVAAMERLRDSEERFRDFAEMASDWFWEADASYRITSVSDWMLDRMGINRADVIGRPLTHITFEDTSTPKWQSHLADLRTFQPFRDFEFSYQLPWGKVRHYRISGKPIFSPDGSFLGYRGTGTDCTGERRIIAALQQREQQLSEAQQIANLGDWRWTVGAERLEWSDGVFRIFGVCRDNFAPDFDYVLSHFLPEDGPLVQEAFDKAIANGTTFEAQYRIRRMDGEQRIVWANGRCEVSDAGEVTHLYGICQDVTDRVRQQQALEQREQELLEAQRIARMGHWRFVVDTRTLEWSPGTYALMGSQPGEYTPTFDDFLTNIHPADRAAVAQKLEDCVRTGQAARCEYRVRTFQDEERTAAIDGQCEFDAAGRVVAVFGIVQDVTEQRYLEGKLRAAKEVAEAASRAKSAFLASMSHELRTPLNAIIGFSEMMEEEVLGPVGNPHYREYAEHIYSSGKHLLSVINDVLDTARVEAGQIELQEEAVDIGMLIKEVVRLLQQQAKAAGQIIQVDIREPAPVVRADLRRLKQVVLNLLGNAIKFTPAGGYIRASVAFGCRTVDIVVSDTGIGIPPDRISELGQPFVQVSDNVLARQHQGSGMGLYICRKLIELHGGSLRIESEPGAGTQVTVSLPANRVMSSRAYTSSH